MRLDGDLQDTDSVSDDNTNDLYNSVIDFPDTCQASARYTGARKLLEQAAQDTRYTPFCKTICGSARLAATPPNFRRDHRQICVRGISHYIDIEPHSSSRCSSHCSYLSRLQVVKIGQNLYTEWWKKKWAGAHQNGAL